MKLFLFRLSIFKDYPYLVALSFLMTVAAAYFSIGSHHPDEHFQILEFANSRLGMSDTQSLPWEFEQQARPTLQPFIAICIIKFMRMIGMDNPFSIAFIIRLMTGIFTWAISLLMIDFYIKQFKKKASQLFLILSTLFLWFIPYLNVRFSSEILAGFSFLLALLLLLKYIKSEHKKSMFIIASGLIFGFSFYFRFQMAPALIGVFVWLIIYKKMNFIDFIYLCISGLVAIFICMGIDIWFYEKLIFTPWNYLYYQLILGKAASFGTSPWWHYFDLFFTNAIPPISIFLFVFFIIGAIKNKDSVLVWIILPFIIMHMGVGHKEMRFLFPILPLFLIITSLGFNHLINKGKVNKLMFITLKLTFVINILLLIYRTFSPAQELMSHYRFLYHITSNQNYLLISIGNPPYEYVGLPVNFYRAPNLETRHFSSYNLAEKYINTHLEKTILILHKKQKLNYNFSNFKANRIYTLLPDWILHYNINNWQSRSNLYSIYSLEKR